MKSEELYENLSEDVKKKLAECRTPDEIRKVLAEAGVEPLDDKLLNAVAGGYGWGMQTPLPVCEGQQTRYV